MFNESTEGGHLRGGRAGIKESGTLSERSGHE